MKLELKNRIGKNKNNDKDKKNKKLLIIIFIIVLLGCFSLTFSYTRNKIFELLFDVPTAPVIDGGSDEWKKSSVISVVKDAKSDIGIKNYQYCITTTKLSDCEWKDTSNKSITVSLTGKYSVYFRAVDTNDKKGSISNKEVVKIDNENPIIESIDITKITTNSISIKTLAKDAHSGIENYFYFMDDENITSKDNTYTFKDLEANHEYTLTVVVTDKLGNQTTVTRKIATLGKENITEEVENNQGIVIGEEEFGMPTYSVEPEMYKWSTYKTVTINYPKGDNLIREYSLDKGKTWKEYTGAVVFNKAGYITARVTKGDETLTAENLRIAFIDNEIPKISLADLPSVIEFGDDYKLPSSYSFGESGGTVECLVNGNKQTSTGALKIGEYTVTCTATSNSSLTATVSKDFEVTYINGNDELWDGWIKLNLNYPENSYDRQWRIADPNASRLPNATGYQDYANWQDYVGPIIIKQADVQYVYIQYKIDGKSMIQSTGDKPVVSIEADKNKLKENEKANVEIIFSDNAYRKQYRINGGDWIDYKEPFKVSANTEINARVSISNDIYDNDGNFVTSQLTSSYDTVFILLDTETPVNPSENDPNAGADSAENKSNATMDGAYVGVEIIADSEDIEIDERANITINASEGAISTRYRVNGGKWSEYNGEFSVTPNSVIEAETFRIYEQEIITATDTKIIKLKDSEEEIVEVEIIADNTSLNDGEETNVLIKYTKNVTSLKYRINESEWISYTSEFSVGPDMMIEVQATSEKGKTITKQLYINHKSNAVIDNSNGQTVLTDDGVLIISSSDNIFNDETSTIKIVGSINEHTTEYRINGGKWNTYTEEFEVGPNTLIDARAVYEMEDENKTYGDSRYINLKERDLEEKIDIFNRYVPDRMYVLPTSKYVELGKTTTVKITADENATEIEYRVNQGTWLPYSGEFEVTSPSIIEAKAVIKAGVSKDNSAPLENDIVLGDATWVTYSSSTHNPLRPSVALSGPSISYSELKDNADKVLVSIAANDSRTTYFSINGASYQEYAAPFEVERDKTIYAYYITNTDGRRSMTSSVYIKPLLVETENGPAMYIDATKHEVSSIVDYYTISLVASGQQTLEYSLDGIIYQNYTGPFKVSQNCKIYARAGNSKGMTYKTLIINDINDGGIPNNPSDKSDIIINAIDEKDLTDDTKIISTLISINYDSRSENKYYKIGASGAWVKYTKPFTVNENTTIYAYQTGNVPDGYATYNVKGYKTGLIDPIITYTPTDILTTQVSVNIEFDDNARIKRYSINGGPYLTYTGEFTVEENCEIVAISSDKNGNIVSNTASISNIGKYSPSSTSPSESTKNKLIILKLHFPSTAISGTLEYNFNEQGWQEYKDDGIIFIYSKFKDEFVDSKGIVNYVDDEGNTITFEGDYYIVESLFDINNTVDTRWENAYVETPEIYANILNDTWTDKVEVTILYDKNSINQQYQLVDEDGNSTEWLTYKDKIVIDKNNTTIYARSEDKSHSYSSVSSYRVTNIGVETDENINKPITGPTTAKYLTAIEKTTNSITIKASDIEATGDIKEYYFKLDDGEYELSEEDTYTFTGLSTNSSHTIRMYAVDVYGNTYGIYKLTTSTYKIDAPIIEVVPDNSKWSTSKKVTITYVDGEFNKEYSLDDGDNWITYEGAFDVVDACNVVARISDENDSTTSQTIALDKTDSTKPIIDNVTVTSLSSRVYISVDAHDDESGILLYSYSVDGINYKDSIYNETTIDGLNHNKNYFVYVKVTNTALNESEIYQVSTATKELLTPTYKMTPTATEWGYTKEIEITYPYEDEDTVKQYSIDLGKTWINYTEPVKIDKENQTVIARIMSGNNIVTASSLFISKVDRTEPTISLDGVPKVIELGESYALPTAYTVDNNKSGGSAVCYSGNQEVTNTSELRTGRHNIECTVTTGAGHSVTITRLLPVLVTTTFDVESILDGVKTMTLDDGDYNFRVTNGDDVEIYTIELWNYDSTTLETTQQLCDNITDKMCVLKYNGDLTINSGVTVTPQVGKKGFLIYASGTLTNNGLITMSSRGVAAEGQNVYMYKNADSTYEYVPAIGAAGGIRNQVRSSAYTSGAAGMFGINRQTGGGGAGGTYNSFAGSGGAGTSYSGGTGGAGAYSNSSIYDSRNGNNFGGMGGVSNTSSSGSGAGNPGGTAGVQGQTGTGGLLIIYGDTFINNQSISSEGTKGGQSTVSGGSSGGGSINIFYNNTYKEGNISTNGGSATSGSAYGGAGGTGSVYISKISSGQTLGTENNKIIVNNVEDYKNMLTYVNYYPSATVVLNSDLDLTGIEVAPLNSSSSPFTGVFEGNNHTITNMSITGNSYTGMFASIKNATIRNLNLKNVDIKSTGSYTASLAGSMTDSVVDNITVSGKINGSNYTGGIIGYTSGGKVTNVSSNVAVTGTSNTAGIVGYAVNSELTDLINENTITGSSNVGGIVGSYINDKGVKLDLSNLVSTGNVGLSGSYGGGIVGYFNSSVISEVNITSSYNTGSVTGSSYIGGVAGYMSSTASSTTGLNKTYSSGDVSGSQYIGGLVGSTNYIIINDSFAVGTLSASSYAGGMIGTANYSSINDSYTLVDVNSSNYAGGMVGTSTSSTATNSYFSSEISGQFATALGVNCRVQNMLYQLRSYTNWDFESIWEIDEEESTAYLKGMQKPESINKENINYYPYDGAGTISNPYLVYNVDDINNIKHDMNGSYKLMNDIDLTGITNLEMIGNNTYPFTGTFDGNGYKISNLSFNKSQNYIGFFGYTSGATIKNLTLENVSMINSTNYTGLLVGRSINGITITNCNIKGVVTGYQYLGGLVGFLSDNNGDIIITDNTISFSENYSNLSYYVGGIASYINLTYDKAVNISNNTINANMTQVYYNGGIAGQLVIGNNVNNVKFNDNIINMNTNTSYSYTGGMFGTSTITGSAEISNNEIKGVLTSSSYVGGMFGYLNQNSANSVINTSGNQVSANINGNSSYTGGIIGQLTGSGKLIIDDTIVSGAISGISYTGGLIGQTSNSSSKDNGLKITKTRVTGSVKGNSSTYVGGFIGYMNTYSSLIENSYVTASVIGSSQTGGMIGYSSNSYQNQNIISKSYTTGAVVGTQYVGGIIGYGITGTIENVYTTSPVSGTTYIGGFIGRSNSYIIKNSYSLGKVTAENNTSNGGFIGYVSGTTIENSYFSSEVAGFIRSAGGINLRVQHMIGQSESFNNWDFESVWEIEEDTMPYLKGVIKPDSVDKDSIINNGIEGSGSIEEPYKIYDFDDLNTVRNNLNANYILMNDIEIPDGTVFKPIGESSLPFTGIFDGQGYTIKGLNINFVTYSYTGLFSSISNATIKNLNLDTILVNPSSNSYASFIAGYATGDVTIKNVSINGQLTGTGSYTGSLIGNYSGSDLIIDEIEISGLVKGSSYVGGLVGYMNTSSAENITFNNITLTDLTINNSSMYSGGLVGGCTTSSIVNIKVTNVDNGSVMTGNGNYAGGLFGNLTTTNTSQVEINNIENTGSINNGVSYVGGLIGQISSSGATSTYTINDINIESNINGNDYVGGLIGYNYITGNDNEVKIKDAIVSSNVTSSGSYVGGLIGNSYVSKTTAFTSVDTSYVTGNVNGSSYVGGLIGYYRAVNSTSIDTSKITKSFTTGNVNGSQYIGGLVGRMTYTSIENAYSTSIVTATSTYVGGAAGQLEYSKLENVYANGKVNLSTVNYTGSLVGTTSQSETINSYFSSELTGVIRTASGINQRIRHMLSSSTSYNDWDFETIWAIDENESTAYLQGFEKPDSVNKSSFDYVDVEGVGSEEEPFKIYNINDLYSIRNELDANYILMNDIEDDGSVLFDPIGEVNYPFTGTFDGQGYTIKGLNISDTSSETGSNVGIFSIIQNATITDLNLDSIKVTGTSNVGALVGQVLDDSTITDITVKNSTIKGSTYTGGLTGTVTTFATIDNVTISENTITSTSSYGGGLLGYVNGNADISNIDISSTINQGSRIGGLIGGINNSIAGKSSTIDTISLDNPVNGTSYTGGLIGTLESSNTSTIEMTNINVSGSVTGTSTYTGGLIAYVNQSTVGKIKIDSVVLDNSVTSQSNYVGGVIGNINNSQGDVNITNTYTTANVKGVSYVGGFIGQANGSSNGLIEIDKTYASGNVTATSSYSGGYIGNANYLQVSNSYSVGKVIGTSVIGGFIGNTSYSTLENTYSTGNITFNALTSGGLVGTSTSSTATNSYYSSQTAGTVRSAIGTNLMIYKLTDKNQSYNSWDFENTWDIVEGETTAYLKGMEIPTMTTLSNLSYTQFEGTGKEDNPYKIYSIDDLNNMRNELDGYYILMNDIEAEPLESFRPIGEAGYPFTGNFDAQDYTINNLYIKSSTELEGNVYTGLFRFISDATIKNLNLTNVNITGGNYTGGLTGYASNTNDIHDIKITGTVIGSSYTGGLIGESNSSIPLTNINVDATITGSSYTGGLIGRGVGYNSLNNVTYNGKVTGSTYTAGIAGQLTHTTSGKDIDFKNITVTATISGSSYTAGDVGYLANQTMNDLNIETINTDVTLTTADNSGGLFGSVLNSADGNTYMSDIEISSAITASTSNLGGVIGRMVNNSAGNIKITDVTSEGSLTGTTSASSKTGGFIGTLENASTGKIEITSSSTSNEVKENYSGSSYTGGFIGEMDNTSTGMINIDYVSALGNVSGNNYVGGLIGYVNQSGKGVNNITNTYTTGTINGTGNYVGGLIGSYAANNLAITDINKTYASGDVSGTNYTGGLIGNAIYAFVENSFSIGDVNKSDYIGGFIGSAVNTTITDCYSLGEVRATGDKIGGFVGYSSNSVATNSYFYATSSSVTKTALGINMRISKMFAIDPCYTLWDFSDTWTIEDGETTAYLKGLPKPLGVGKDTIDYTYVNGDGTEEDPFVITSYLDLLTISSDLDAYYVLANDITIPSDKPIYPIAFNTSAFTGTFDGQGHKIIDYTISNINSNVGIFGYVDGGTIKNLVIENAKVNITSTTALNSGILAGYATGNFEFDNITLSGNITSQGSRVGGLVGAISTDSGDVGVIKNITTTATVNGTADYIGGLIGYASYDNEISKIKLNTTVNGSNTASNYIGGIFGGTTGVDGRTVKLDQASVDITMNDGYRYGAGFAGTSNYLDITNSYTTGNITITDYASGMIGTATNTTIKNSYTILRNNVPSINGAVATYGGISINTSASNDFTTAYYSNYITKASTVTDNTGTNVDAPDLLLKSTFKDFNFDTIWVMGDSSPYLAIDDGEINNATSIINTYEFAFNRSYQVFTAPRTGTYKMEVYGAQSTGNSMGGYSKGEITLEKGQTLYIYNGGQGYGSTGGYNGGGGGSYAAGGGTDIRLTINDLYSRILVAGGASYYYHGGGSSGGGVYSPSQTGGGYTFGSGNSYQTDFNRYYYSCYAYPGGGGWYGGLAFAQAYYSYGKYYCHNYHGGGGSGYVLTSTSYRPAGYNVDSKFEFSNASTQSGVNDLGNGYTRITYMPDTYLKGNTVALTDGSTYRIVEQSNTSDNTIKLMSDTNISSDTYTSDNISNVIQNYSEEIKTKYGSSAVISIPSIETISTILGITTPTQTQTGLTSKYVFSTNYWLDGNTWAVTSDGSLLKIEVSGSLDDDETQIEEPITYGLRPIIEIDKKYIQK